MSYRQFCETYGATVEKFYFPYEFLDSPEMLSWSVDTIRYEDFHNSLTNRNLLNEEYAKYEEFMSKHEQASLKDALKALKLKGVPKRGTEIFEEIKEVWAREGIQTIRDYLVYYNICDTTGFVECLGKMKDFYFEECGIDMLYTAISAPGIARRLVFDYMESPEGFVSIKDRMVYKKLKQNMVGGPTIVFCRHQEVGVTKICGGETCKR